MAKRRRHRRGEGSVLYDRTARVWVARISLGTVDGKRIRHKLTAPTEAEARNRLETLHRTYGRGGEVASMTVDAYLHWWLDGHKGNIAPSTVLSYRNHIDLHIGPLLGGMRMMDVRPTDVRRLLVHVQRPGYKAHPNGHPVSPATAGRILATLRVAFGQAAADRALPDDPTDGVRAPRVVREPDRALTAADVQDILAAVKGDKLEALYTLLLGSGIRIGEACALDWRDVDLDAGTVLIRRSKGKRPRVAAVAPWAIRSLRAHRAASKVVGPREPVFRGERTGERLSRMTPAHAFPRLLERAKLPPMRVHDLRHGHATRLLAKGASMRTIADQLGHANPSMTNRYAHVQVEAARDAVAMLDDDVPEAIGSRNGSRDG